MSTEEVQKQAQEEPKIEKTETPKTEKTEQPKQENQQKKEKEITIEDFKKMDMRVGRLIEVWAHPESEKLYCEKIDCGEEEPRQILSGLRQFIPQDQMNGLVLVLANLKSRKLAGMESNGMVLCASNEDHTQIELMRPHPDSQVGERVVLENLEMTQEREKVMNPKHKIAENCLPLCKTNENMEGTFLGQKFFTSAGVVACTTLKKANIS